MSSDSPLLADITDERLEVLAREWRARAARGEKDAYGIAHSLEVEVRSRSRASQRAALTYTTPSPGSPRRWWQFWRSRDAGRLPGADT